MMLSVGPRENRGGRTTRRSENPPRTIAMLHGCVAPPKKAATNASSGKANAAAPAAAVGRLDGAGSEGCIDCPVAVEWEWRTQIALFHAANQSLLRQSA